MNIAHHVVGCDISKEKIDFFDTHSARHTIIANRQEHIEQFLAPYVGCNVRFAFEATGFYGHALRAALTRQRLEAVQINPLHGRRFTQSTGRLAKTDRIDAIQIARMVQRLDLQPNNDWDEQAEQLKSLIIRRDQLVDMRAGEKKRIRQTQNEALIESILRHISMLDEEIVNFNTLIDKAIADNDKFNHKYRLLTSIPGIEPVIAAVLVGMLPETGRVKRCAIAALAGLAPLAWDSGKYSARRSIAGGRPRVHRALYQAALSTIKGNSKFAQRYRTLKNQGKPTKVALIAVARKILTTANAMLKTNKPYAT